MDGSKETDQRRPAWWRAASASLWRSLLGKAPRSMASGFISGAVIAAAATPFAGWRTPVLWFVVNSALVIGSHA